MNQYRHLIDLVHTVVVLDDEVGLEWMVEALPRRQYVGRDVPIVCGQSSFLGNLCKMVMVIFMFEGICTDKHVPLVLWTPAGSVHAQSVVRSNGRALTTRQTSLQVAGHWKT